MRYQSQSNLINCFWVIKKIGNAVDIRKCFKIIRYRHAFRRTFIVDGIVLAKDFCNGRCDGRTFRIFDNQTIQSALPLVQNEFRVPGEYIIPLCQFNLKTGKDNLMPVDMMFLGYNKNASS